MMKDENEVNRIAAKTHEEERQSLLSPCQPEGTTHGEGHLCF